MPKRTQQDDHGVESRIHKVIRKMIVQRIEISRAFATGDGTMVHAVNGHLLTTDQILELDSNNELTSWGIRDYAVKLGEHSRTERNAGD